VRGTFILPVNFVGVESLNAVRDGMKSDVKD
jgi:hypothetical protein